MKLLRLVLIIGFAYSCKTDAKSVNYSRESEVDSTIVTVENMEAWLIDSLHAIGLVDISLADERIFIDLRYSTNNNFLHRQLYDTLTRAFLQKEVMDRLILCQNFLDSIKPGYRLKVFDAVRPLRVQREMWESLDSVPVFRRGKFVSNPYYGSVHNYGCAVDLTICNERGEELDMGAGYDDFREIAFPSKETYYLGTGELSQEQYQNRLLLRRVMHSQKFSNIPSEWWHFNAYSRYAAESKFEILLNESGSHMKWIPKPRPKMDSIQLDVEAFIE